MTGKSSLSLTRKRKAAKAYEVSDVTLEDNLRAMIYSKMNCTTKEAILRKIETGFPALDIPVAYNVIMRLDIAYNKNCDSLKNKVDPGPYSNSFCKPYTQTKELTKKMAGVNLNIITTFKENNPAYEPETIDALTKKYQGLVTTAATPV